ncbi:MAG: lysophospholipid acyltransferase family protein [Chloroflexi bacterium]|nr:lysophospholipid acyltransferase family protein [Chloroflexota bacterium]
MKIPRIDALYRFGRFTSKVFLPTFGSMEVVGLKNVPRDGALLIACNHQNYADPAVLVYAIDRPIWFMAKRSLFRGRFLSFFFRNVHVFPVDRDGRDFEALRWAQETLDKGRALVVFPEGTRSPGALKRGQDGLAYIALRTGATILPVAITGTEGISPMLRMPFHFQKLNVVIGEPYTLPPAQRIDRALLESVTIRIMRSIATLLPPGYRGAYADEVESLPPMETTD